MSDAECSVVVWDQGALAGCVDQPACQTPVWRLKFHYPRRALSEFGARPHSGWVDTPPGFCGALRSPPELALGDVARSPAVVAPACASPRLGTSDPDQPSTVVSGLPSTIEARSPAAGRGAAVQSLILLQLAVVLLVCAPPKLRERIDRHDLTVTTNDGEKTIPLEQAAADYLRAVRNAGHAMRESMKDATHRALLVSHTGALAPEVSDIAFLHFLRILVEPTLLRPL
jgi:hypothetical protein